MLLNNVKIAWKLSFLLGICVIVVCALEGYSIVDSRDTMVSDRKLAIRQVVEAAVSVADYYHAQALSGAMTDEAAKEQAGNALRAFRYDNGNYLYVYNANGITEIHGTRKELEGKYRLDEKDKAGKMFIREQLSKSAAGGGFTSYRFTKSGSGDTLFEKISYDKPFSPWNWSVGGGVYLDDIDAAFQTKLKTVLGVAGAVILVMTVLMRMLTRSITEPMAKITESMKCLVDGDLTVETDALERQDEIGTLARSSEQLRQSLIKARETEATLAHQKEEAAQQRKNDMHQLADSFEQSVSGVVNSVSSNANQMQNMATSLDAMAKQSTRQASSVASATEQASNAVQTVAAAAEELSASIREIGRQVTEASSIANTASDDAGKTNMTVRELADTASRIGDVVKLINDIASQTNLLALNATIEAARAGEAGKGFAVVAGEVKNLANQTARATDEIGSQIGSVQAQTQNVVEAIGLIVKRIQDISHVSTAIASAVEEQSAATAEIAGNVSQAAQGTNLVSASIGGVSDAASSTGAASQQVLASAQSLSSEAEQLKGIVSKFLHDVRMA